LQNLLYNIPGGSKDNFKGSKLVYWTTM